MHFFLVVNGLYLFTAGPSHGICVFHITIPVTLSFYNKIKQKFLSQDALYASRFTTTCRDERNCCINMQRVQIICCMIMLVSERIISTHLHTEWNIKMDATLGMERVLNTCCMVMLVYERIISTHLHTKWNIKMEVIWAQTQRIFKMDVPWL